MTAEVSESLFSDAERILLDLRWKDDAAIINPEGEHVWLKQMSPCEGSPHGYLTDCCFVSEPCERHRRED